MALTFLTPLLLGAAAFAVIPWVLHHIRRPERKPVVFSSLMFVPDVKKEVIERRRLQHLLLMLLRIATLLLLAFAFARPFLPLPPVGAARDGASRHVIAIDTSYSMTAGGAFDAAKAKALGIIDGLDSNAKAAVIAFGATPRPLAPLSTPQDARSAVTGVQPTLETTAYEPALRLASDLLAPGEDAESVRKVVHFITDFQEAGMPQTAPTWRLPQTIEFDPIDVRAVNDNASVADVHLAETASGKLNLRTKVKNWSVGAQKTIDVRLRLDGASPVEKSIETAPGNASQVAFEIPAPIADGLRGWVEIDDSSLAADNRRYFTWNPRLKRRVFIVGSADAATEWPVSEILRLALTGSSESMWAVEIGETLATDAVTGADVAIVADASSLGANDAAALMERLANPGATLVILGAGTPDDAMLRTIGLESAGYRFDRIDPIGFVTWSWLDFKHPVFSPFAESRFNDFTDIRFYNHHVLSPAEPLDDNSPRALARFEPLDGGDGPAAIFATQVGGGRAVVWAFDLGFEWTNLAKTARFVPLLQETLLWLTGGPDTPRNWLIGQQPSAPREEFASALQMTPGEASRPYETAALERAGYLEWHGTDANTTVRVEPINVDADEGNPTAIAPAEFALRLCSSPVLREDLTVDTTRADGGGTAEPTSWEYGRFVLAAIVAALFGEIWYAGRLR